MTPRPALLLLFTPIVILLIACGGDGDDGEPAATSTAATGTPATPAATGTPAASATPGDGASTPATINEDDPDDALDAYIQQQFGAEHIGDCPSSPSGDIPEGICSNELYRSDELVTFFVGPPFSEGLGEVVLTRAGNGWLADFVPAPELGATIEVGGDVVVYGAGDCLNFRQAPATDAEQLACWVDGTRGTVAEGPEQGGEHTWWRIEDYGWASEEYLAPVSE